MTNLRTWLGAAIVTFLLTAVSIPATVVSDCSESALAEAIEAGGTTTLGCDGDIDISEALQVTNEVVLEATGNVRLVGMGDTRLFEVSTTGSLTLSNFTLAGGETTNGGGGAIFSRGTLVLISCTISNNVANGPPGRDGRAGDDGEETNGDDGQDGTAGRRTAGGAIYNLGVFRALECAFFGNRAVGGNGGAGGSGDTAELVGGDGGRGGAGGTAFGGAIFNGNQAEIFNSQFYFNEARGGDGAEGAEGGDGRFPGFAGHGGRGGVGAGGAIYATNKSMTLIVGSTFSENTVFSGNSVGGGGNNNSGRAGAAGANAFGGGFCNYGSAVVINATFNANEIQAGNGAEGATSDLTGGDGGDGGTAWGGNLFNGGKGVAVTNCTFNGGIARPGTNGLAGVGSFPGDDGRIGSTRGANVGNGKGKFFLSHSILVNPPSTNLLGTNTTITWETNIISDVRGGTNALKEVCTRVQTTRGNGTVIRDEFNCINAGRFTDTNGVTAGTTVKITTNVTKVTVADIRANAAGAFKDGGYNLSSDRSISFKKKSTSRANMDALLGPLEDYGGPTETLEPLDGSPAIDAGDPDNSLEIDQRGIERPQGLIGDIGAVEVKVGPPEAISEPMDVDVYSGENVSFAWVVSGRRIRFQWYFNDSPIADATNSTLLLTNVQLAQAGTYHAVATNLFGEISSENAALGVTESEPIVTNLPASTNVAAGATLTLVASATGSRPLQYQWHFTNQSSVTAPIANATNATLVVANFGAANEGNYTVEVTNPIGSTFSNSTSVQRAGSSP